MKTISEYIKENRKLKQDFIMLKSRYDKQIKLNIELDAELGKRNVELKELKEDKNG